VPDIFDPTFGNIERAMEIATRRQEVITHNIANADTPGFEALTFDEYLMQAKVRADKQTVNLEEEMADLTKNSIAYSSYVKLMSAKFNVLRTIATQGRR